MAANTQPIFTVTPQVGVAQVNTANPNRDGTGTIATLITGAIYGTRINRIEIQAISTTTAGMIRFFINDGVNTRLWREITVNAITPSAIVAAFTASIVPSEPLVLPSGHSLRVSTEKAEAFNIFVHGGNY